MNLGSQWGIDTSLWSKKWQELSGGESQRILLAISMSREPSIILLDEPTSSLDLPSALLVEKTMKKYAVGHGIILVSHDSDQINRLNPTKSIHIELLSSESEFSSSTEREP